MIIFLIRSEKEKQEEQEEQIEEVCGIRFRGGWEDRWHHQ